MRQGNILDGIRAGFQSYMQTRQWGEGMKQSKLAQEQMALTNRMQQQRVEDYLTPEQELQAKLDAAAKGREADYTFGREKGLPQYMTPEERLEFSKKEWTAKGGFEDERAKRIYEETGFWPAGYVAQPSGRSGGMGDMKTFTGLTNDIMNTYFGGIQGKGVGSIPVYTKVAAKVAQGDYFGANATARVWSLLHPMDKDSNFSASWMDNLRRDPKTGEPEQPYFLDTGSGSQPVDPEVYLERMAMSNEYTDRDILVAAQEMERFYTLQAGPPVPDVHDMRIRALAAKYNISDREARELYLQTLFE